jgi:ribose 5-phosphate isomerase B
MSQDEEIRALVRKVVTRTLGATEPTAAARLESRNRAQSILDAETVRHMPTGSSQMISPDTLVTPLARQVAMERRIKLTTTDASAATAPAGAADHGLRQSKRLNKGKMVVALGTDHGGLHLKEQIKKKLESGESGYRVIDCGTHSAASVDYPDFAYAVAQLVADGRAWRGIIIDGAGIGSCMAANKVPGVRAAMCYDQATAINSREHNNANVLTLGAGLIGANLAEQIVTTWLKTEFGGGRHARRVEKIDRIEDRFSKK